MDFTIGGILTGLLLACFIVLMCIHSWLKDLSDDLATIRRLLSTKTYDISSMHPTSIATAGEFGDDYTNTFRNNLESMKNEHLRDSARTGEYLTRLREYVDQLNKKVNEIESKLNDIYFEE